MKVISRWEVLIPFNFKCCSANRMQFWGTNEKFPVDLWHQKHKKLLHNFHFFALRFFVHLFFLIWNVWKRSKIHEPLLFISLPLFALPENDRFKCIPHIYFQNYKPASQYSITKYFVQQKIVKTHYQKTYIFIQVGYDYRLTSRLEESFLFHQKIGPNSAFSDHNLIGVICERQPAQTEGSHSIHGDQDNAGYTLTSLEPILSSQASVTKV